MALTQAAYRFGSDTGTNETDHGWLAAQNTGIRCGVGGDVALDTVFLLRFGYQNDATAASNINFTVQYKINAGSWVTIGTATAGVDAEAATVLTNNGNTTQRLTGLSGTFQGATGQAEDGDAGGNSMDIASNGCAEAVFSIKVNSAGVAEGDTITFQSLQEGGALAAYSVTPTIYVTRSEAPSVGGMTLAGIAPSLLLAVAVGAGSMGLAGQTPATSRFTVELKQSDTTIATRGVGATGTLATHEFELTETERGNISDWGALRLSFAATGKQIEVTWAEVEAPAAEGGATPEQEAPSLGALTFAGLAPSLNREYSTAPSGGILAFAGLQPTVSINRWIDPDALAETVGAISSGVLANVYVRDDTDLVLTETLGTPGFAYDFTFEGIQGTARGLTFYGRYEGNVGHRVKVQQYNYGSTTWANLTSELGDLPHSTSDYEVHLPLLGYSGDWVSGGQLKIRITHTTAGSNTHLLYVDELTLSESYFPLTTVGAMVLAGMTPEVGQTHSLEVGAGTLAATGLEPVSTLTRLTLPDAGAIALSGETPQVGQTHSFEVPVGALAFQGTTPTQTLAHLTEPGVGSVEIAGTLSTVSEASGDFTATPDAGTVAFAGETPVVPTLTVFLLEGDTTRVTRYVFPDTALTTYAMALTTDERNAIGNWGTLRLSLVADGDQMEVSWAEVETPAAVAGVTEAPEAVSLALAGLAPTIFSPFLPASATLTLAGELPVVPAEGDQTASPGTGSMVLAGIAPVYDTIQLLQGSTLIAERQLVLTDSYATYEFALTTEEIAAVTSWGDLYVVVTANGERVYSSWIELQAPDGYISPAVATLTFSGETPATTPVVSPSAGALTLAGPAPSLDRTYLTAPSAGSMASAGTVPTIAVDEIRGPSVGALEFTGAAPEIFTGFRIEVGSGAAFFAGSDPAVFSPFLPDVVALTLSGVAMTEGGVGYVIAVGEGSMTVTGGDAPTVFTPFQPASVGLTFAGVSPAATYTGEIEPPTGSLAFGGIAPSLAYTLLATPAVGTLAVSGEDVAWDIPPEVNVRSVVIGAIALTGQAPTVNLTYLITPGVEVLTFAGGRPGHYPYGLLWTDQGIVSAGMDGGALVVAGAPPGTLVAAGIDGQELEYET